MECLYGQSIDITIEFSDRNLKFPTLIRTCLHFAKFSLRSVRQKFTKNDEIFSSPELLYTFSK